MSKVTLTPEQQASLHFYFDPDNPYREEESGVDYEMEIEIRDVFIPPDETKRYLYINGTYLYDDGEWGFPHPASYRGTR
jgi:hypothetical protein